MERQPDTHGLDKVMLGNVIWRSLTRQRGYSTSLTWRRGNTSGSDQTDEEAQRRESEIEKYIYKTCKKDVFLILNIKKKHEHPFLEWGMFICNTASNKQNKPSEDFKL